MHARQPVPDAVARLTTFQGGVITREQACGLGLSRHVLARVVRDGLWVPVCPGVFATGALDWSALAWAGVLVGGEGARLGGSAAGFAAGLVDQQPEEIQVWLPTHADLPSRQPDSARWWFRREAIGVRGPGTGSPPRTNIDDTVLDLAAHGSEAETIGWVSASVQRRLTTPRRLLTALEARQRCRHRRLIRSVLADVAEGAQSPLEIDYLREVERSHGLPTARRQARGRGTWVDALYEDYGLVVELDGRAGHTGAGRFRDMARDNLSTGAGLATLRYGWADVKGRPCAVSVQVAQVLTFRGWRGEWHACRRCRTLRVSDLTA